MADQKTVYVVYTNTDLLNGEGQEVAIAVCDTKETAERLASGRGVRGNHGKVCIDRKSVV